MRPKLKISLPMIQILVAVVLLTSNYLRPVNTPHNPSWTAPDRQFCDGLNAPAALVKNLLLVIVHRELPFPYSDWVGLLVETVVYLGLIGLLWYIVAVEVEGGTRRPASGSNARTGVRPIADSLMIAFGITLAIATTISHRGAGTYYGLFGILHLFWAVVIGAFYGHDLWIVFRQRAGSTD